MAAKDDPVAKKSRAHIVYKTPDGKRVPGVTTITGMLDKPGLVKWANNLGLQGIDSTEHVKNLARIGTLAHLLIATEWKNTMEANDADKT
jgi:ketopantoate reductase